MSNYKMNFATKTLTITKAFAAMAMKPNTEEANVLAHMKSLFPDLKIAYKTHYCSKPHPYKGLTYNKMEKYIRLRKNRNELLIAFSTVKELGRTQPNPHSYVCKWFLEQFPDFGEIPELEGGMLPEVPLIDIPEAETNNMAA